MLASYMENQSVRLPVGDKLTALFALPRPKVSLAGFSVQQKKNPFEKNRSFQNAYKSPRTIPRLAWQESVPDWSWPPGRGHIFHKIHTHTNTHTCEHPSVNWDNVQEIKNVNHRIDGVQKASNGPRRLAGLVGWWCCCCCHVVGCWER